MTHLDASEKRFLIWNLKAGLTQFEGENGHQTRLLWQVFVCFQGHCE